MGSKVAVSIGMPVYNGSKSLRTALDSLLSQTFTDFELIISDNDSNDETEIICREYVNQDKRIRYIRQKTNIGAMPNFQFVLDNATGEYFMWASHDDYWHEDFIVKNLDNLSKDVRAVGSIGNVLLCNKNGREKRSGADNSIIGTKFERLKNFIIYPNDNSRFYSLFKKRALEELNLNKYNFHASDWFVTFKILLHGNLLNINETLLKRHEQETNHYAKQLKEDNKNYITFGLPLIPLTINIIRSIPIYYTIFLANKLYKLNRFQYKLYQMILFGKKMNSIEFKNMNIS